MLETEEVIIKFFEFHCGIYALVYLFLIGIVAFLVFVVFTFWYIVVFTHWYVFLIVFVIFVVFTVLYICGIFALVYLFILLVPLLEREEVISSANFIVVLTLRLPGSECNFNTSSEVKVEGADVEGRLQGVNVVKVIPVGLPGMSVLYVVSLLKGWQVMGMNYGSM